MSPRRTRAEDEEGNVTTRTVISERPRLVIRVLDSQGNHHEPGVGRMKPTLQWPKQSKRSPASHPWPTAALDRPQQALPHRAVSRRRRSRLHRPVQRRRLAGACPITASSRAAKLYCHTHYRQTERKTHVRRS